MTVPTGINWEGEGWYKEAKGSDRVHIEEHPVE